MASVQMAKPTTERGPTTCREAETTAIQGEPPGFETFFARYEKPLCGYLRRMVPSNEVALELAQEAFLRAWQHFDELLVYDRPEAWLYRVATNLAISYLRRKQSLCFAQVYQHSGDEGDPDEYGFDADFLADPFDMEQQTADKVLIEQTLQQLAQRQRTALLLRTVYGLSCQEISDVLGMSVANVRQTLTRGRERFRKLYRAAYLPARDPFRSRPD